MILTPHIGGSTEEAQERIGAEVARKLVEYSEPAPRSARSISPRCYCRRARSARAIMHVHRNVPGMLGRLNETFSRRGFNIAAQYLQTDGELGYVVVDAEVPAEESAPLLEAMRRSRARSAPDCSTSGCSTH